MTTSPVWAQGKPLARLNGAEGQTAVMRTSAGPSLAPVNRGMPLQTGYYVETAARSFASLLFTDGRYAKLNENTELELKASAPNGIRLVKGKIYARFPPGGAFVEGPAATVFVHGTELQVEVTEDGTTTVTVAAGEVKFANDQGAQVVRDNQQSVARPGEAPTRPSVVDATGIVAWEASVETLAMTIEAPPAPAGDVLAARVNEARLALHEGHVDVAEAAYTRLAAEQPASAEGPLGLGMRYLATGSVAQALPQLERAAELDPRSVRAITFLGVARLRQGDVAAAQAAFQQALAIDHRFYPAHAYRSFALTLEGQLEEAVGAAREAVTLAPPESVLAHEALANALFYAGRFAAAEKEVLVALQANPLSATAQLAQAKILVATDRLEEGSLAARQAAELDPGNAVAHSTLGVILLAQNDNLGAERAFKSALKLAPQTAAAQSGLGAVFAQRGQLAQALAQQKAALALDGSSADARNNLGAVYLAQGRLATAVGEFRQAAALRPNWGLPHANLAQAYLERNQYAEALTEAQAAVRLGEESAVLRTVLARVYQRLQRTDRALSELQLAEALDPDYPQAQFQLSRIYLEQGRDLDALRTILRATSVHPGAMVENRLYARTETALSAGSQDTRRLEGKTDGRALDGTLSYFSSGTYGQTDNDRRENGDQRQSFGLGVVGLERGPAHQWLFYGSRFHRKNGRPGSEIDGAAEDPNFRSQFDGWETHLIHRLRTGLRSYLTLKVGRRDADLEDHNPDSLMPVAGRTDEIDPKPFRRLDTRDEQTLAEARWDARLSRSDRVTVGFAWRDESQRLRGDLVVVDPAGGAGTSLQATSERADETRRTFYGEWRRRAGERFDLKLGGYVDVSAGLDTLALPKLVARYRPAGRSYLVFLAYPRFQSDASELSPVEAWAQPLGFNRLDFSPAGWSMSYELHYQQPFSHLSLLTLSAFTRNAHSLLLDLQDPRLAATPVRALIGRARISGAQAALEQTLGRTLSARLFLRYQDAQERGQDQDLPYFERFQGGIRLDYLDRTGWRSFLSLRYIGSRAPDRQTRGSDLPAPEARRRLPGYPLLDFRIARQLDLQHSLFLEIDNVLDRQYETYLNYPAVGRSVFGGVEYRF